MIQNAPVFSLFLALVMLVVAGHAPAQGPQGGGLELDLLDQTGAPVGASATDFEAHLSGPPGAWSYVFARVYVTLPTYPSERVEQYRAMGFDQWLSQISIPDAASALPGLTFDPLSHPELSQDPGLVLDHYERWIANDDPDAVRAHCQPILVDISGAPMTLIWDAQTATWRDNEGPGGGFTLVREWTDELTWPEPTFEGSWPNTWSFNLGRMIQTAVFRQAPSEAAAKEFLNDWIVDAAEWGLYVDVQAMAAIDNVSEPGSTANETGGFPSLPTSPLVILSGTRTVQPPLTPPTGGGGPGVTIGPVGAVLGPKAHPTALILPIDQMLPPLTAQVVIGTRSVVLHGEVDDVGYARFSYPVMLSIGTPIAVHSITNALGTTLVTNPGWNTLVILLPIDP